MNTPVDCGVTAPLSFGQEQLWFLDQLTPGQTTYNVMLTTRLRGPLDVPALRGAVTLLVERHEALRVTISATDGVPFQVVSPPAEVELPILDHSASAGQEQQAAVQATIEELSRQPFDLQIGPLYRYWLLKLAEDHHLFVQQVHHVISDGWSSGLIEPGSCRGLRGAAGGPAAAVRAARLAVHPVRQRAAGAAAGCGPGGGTLLLGGQACRPAGAGVPDRSAAAGGAEPAGRLADPGLLAGPAAATARAGPGPGRLAVHGDAGRAERGAQPGQRPAGHSDRRADVEPGRSGSGRRRRPVRQHGRGALGPVRGSHLRGVARARHGSKPGAVRAPGGAVPPDRGSGAAGTRSGPQPALPDRDAGAGRRQLRRQPGPGRAFLRVRPDALDGLALRHGHRLHRVPERTEGFRRVLPRPVRRMADRGVAAPDGDGAHRRGAGPHAAAVPAADPHRNRAAGTAAARQGGAVRL